MKCAEKQWLSLHAQFIFHKSYILNAATLLYRTRCVKFYTFKNYWIVLKPSFCTNCLEEWSIHIPPVLHTDGFNLPSLLFPSVVWTFQILTIMFTSVGIVMEDSWNAEGRENQVASSPHADGSGTLRPPLHAHHFFMIL